MSKSLRSPEKAPPEEQQSSVQPGRGVAVGEAEGLGLQPAPAIATQTPILEAAGLEPSGPVALADGASEIAVENWLDMGGDKARKKVGVGEKSFFTIPDETGTWTASDGRGAMDDGAFRWTAGDTAGAVTITVRNAAGKSSSVVMTVVAPTTVTGANPVVVAQPSGQAGGGMKLDLVIGPTDVSFSELLWSEVAGPASNLQGYFEGKSPPDHVPHAESKPGERNAIQDTATFAWSGGKPWSAGSYDWVIPNRWRLPGGRPKELIDVTQRMEILDASGSGKVTKAGLPSDG